MIRFYIVSLCVLSLLIGFQPQVQYIITRVVFWMMGLSYEDSL